MYEFNAGLQTYNDSKARSRLVRSIDSLIRSIDEKWGIENVTAPIFQVEEDNWLSVRISYDSKGWKEFCSNF